MFVLHAVQAQFGDSLILQFGSKAKPRFVLVDGGPPDNFDDDLEAALKQIVGAKGKLELAMLSHIDNDHVVGLVDLLAALEGDDVNNKARRVAIGGLWHNSFEKTADPDGAITQGLQGLMIAMGAAGMSMPLAANSLFGVEEGARLRVLAKKLKIPINKGFKDDLILVETAKKAIKLGPLSLRIVGPNKANLKELRKKWLAWLAKVAKKAATDPKAAAMADQSIPNLSSVVVLAECEGKSVLLTGDARGDFILDGLKTAGLLKNGKIHVDVFKVQHHGSDRNTSLDFLSKVTADTYVISANGKDKNPDYKTLTWIVKAARAAGRKIEIVVTNATQSTAKLKKDFNPKTNGYKLTVMAKAKHSIAVELSP